MTAKDRFDPQVFKSRLGRRALLGRLGVAGAGLALAPSLVAAQDASPELDAKILNFALNLEYLEAEYYLRAVQGRGLEDAELGDDPGEVTGGSEVPFQTERLREFAAEIARDEAAHVRFLRFALGSAAVSRPAINFSDAFTGAARAAGVVGANDDFDPFASELGFLFGAFLFEDVGVSAYKGAAPFIGSGDYKEAAAGILAVEAYHAGNVRTQLYLEEKTKFAGQTVVEVAQKISDARDLLDGDGDADQGVKYDNPAGTEANIVLADENAVAYGRTPRQVLNIVYLDLSGGATPGGFFPEGLKGDFSGVPSL